MFEYILQIYVDDRYWYERPCANYQEIQDTVQSIRDQQKSGYFYADRTMHFRVYAVNQNATRFAEEMFHKTHTRTES